MTLEEHITKWSSCNRCPLGRMAHKHCLYDVVGEGKPNILFLGEGPGRSEDVIGRPFTGPAGRLLRKALAATKEECPYVLANLVACRAQNRVGGDDREPHPDEIDLCSGRLDELGRIFNPAVVVCLGRIASENMSIDSVLGKKLVCNTWHPSYVLRDGGEKSAKYPEYVRKLGIALKLSQDL